MVCSGKRFQCSECDFTSVSKPSLLRHMEQHAEFKVKINTQTDTLIISCHGFDNMIDKLFRKINSYFRFSLTDI